MRFVRLFFDLTVFFFLRLFTLSGFVQQFKNFCHRSFYSTKSENLQLQLSDTNFFGKRKKDFLFRSFFFRYFLFVKIKGLKSDKITKRQENREQNNKKLAKLTKNLVNSVSFVIFFSSSFFCFFFSLPENSKRSNKKKSHLSKRRVNM